LDCAQKTGEADHPNWGSSESGFAVRLSYGADTSDMFRFFQRPKRAALHKASDGFKILPAGRISLTSEGAVFLHLETGTVFRSNRVGARIWRGVLDGQNQEYIADEISREYGAPREQVAQHTAQFLTELESAGFLARYDRR
jgi:hypothetical protein